jgi:proprotein convertase subtilisin/kexin type 5
VAVYTCPSGYYKEHGICYKCPIGCSTCTNSTTCLTCNAALYLRTTVGTYSNVINSAGNLTVVWSTNITLCACKDGYYGTNMVALNTIQCASCDPSCKTCANSSVICTSCSSPTFLTDTNTCTLDCTADSSHANYYGNTTYQTCQ